MSSLIETINIDLPVNMHVLSLETLDRFLQKNLLNAVLKVDIVCKLTVSLMCDNRWYARRFTIYNKMLLKVKQRNQ